MILVAVLAMATFSVVKVGMNQEPNCYCCNEDGAWKLSATIMSFAIDEWFDKWKVAKLIERKSEMNGM